jgi:predicted nucleic acid-binding protein
MAKPTAFVDSSVIIAALLSSEGGSFHILTQYRGFFAFQINEYVLAEIQQILRSKFRNRPSLITELFLLLGVADISVLANPGKRDVMRAAEAISQNDAPILASALRSSDYLITLDNDFFTKLVLARARDKSLVIAKPGDLLYKFRTQRAA